MIIVRAKFICCWLMGLGFFTSCHTVQKSSDEGIIDAADSGMAPTLESGASSGSTAGSSALTTAEANGVPPPPPPPPTGASGQGSAKNTPHIYEQWEEDDWNEEQMRKEDMDFFKSGRYFGFGLLAGTTQMTGTLASLYYSGWFNSYDFSMYVFVDKQWAFELGVGVSKHFFAIYSSDRISNIGRVDVRLRKYQAKIKYFFELPKAPVHPYLTVAGASFERQYSFADLSGNPRVTDSAPAIGGGAGIDIPIMAKSVYIRLDGLFYSVQFPDELSGDLADAGFPDLAGDAFTLHGGVLLNW